MQERRPVIISEDVIEYLAKLTHTLFKNGYFDYFDSALEYVDELYDKISSSIYTTKHIAVPEEHKLFGDFYFVIKANRRTAWHVYFIKNKDTFYITKVLNNHLSTARF